MGRRPTGYSEQGRFSERGQVGLLYGCELWSCLGCGFCVFLSSWEHAAGVMPIKLESWECGNWGHELDLCWTIFSKSALNPWRPVGSWPIKKVFAGIRSCSKYYNNVHQSKYPFSANVFPLNASIFIPNISSHENVRSCKNTLSIFFLHLLSSLFVSHLSQTTIFPQQY